MTDLPIKRQVVVEYTATWSQTIDIDEDTYPPYDGEEGKVMSDEQILRAEIDQDDEYKLDAISHTTDLNISTHAKIIETLDLRKEETNAPRNTDQLRGSLPVSEV